jgi:hypothetical protein
MDFFAHHEKNVRFFLQDGMRISVSEGDWTAAWNGTAVTVHGPDRSPLTFSLRSVTVLKLAVSNTTPPLLLVATTDRKLLVWDVSAGGGRCVRLLAFKAAVTDIRANGTVAAIVLEDLSLHFYKLGQLIAADKIDDAR